MHAHLEFFERFPVTFQVYIILFQRSGGKAGGWVCSALSVIVYFEKQEVDHLTHAPIHCSETTSFQKPRLDIHMKSERG